MGSPDSIVCPKTAQPRPVVCLPVYSSLGDEVPSTVVVCQDCHQQQPEGAAAVKAYYEQLGRQA